MSKHVDSLFKTLKNMGPLPQKTANFHSKNRAAQQQRLRYVWIGLVACITSLALHTFRETLPQGVVEPIQIVCFVIAVAAVSIWFYRCCCCLREEEFVKFQLMNQFDLRQAKNLLSYPKETLVQASQLITLKIEEEEHYASLLKPVPPALAGLLIVFALLSPPNFLHEWLQYMFGCISVTISFLYIVWRANVVGRYMYLKKILTLVLDHKAGSYLIADQVVNA